ncbi:MAG: hypothetical protein MK289_11825 [Trichodesmium sp. ALOHA_ZT_67]|uniref:hypothetical protein n=1 Tax=Trichodesmium erythraeum TaxID=1206 RepID=UPI000325796C|nr:hypothetical protein [Trichodesmium erythraeum GBRTRLIN201]MCH2049139.1 hypothetical protein [Trichodesmium sp. ALOHA_ZT_67]MDE5094884.1 hypothetical protein [Trichodesmium sp. St11_bin5]
MTKVSLGSTALYLAIASTIGTLKLVDLAKLLSGHIFLQQLYRLLLLQKLKQVKGRWGGRKTAWLNII